MVEIRNGQKSETTDKAKHSPLFVVAVICLLVIGAVYICNTWYVSIKNQEKQAIQMAEAVEAGISKSLISKLINDPEAYESEDYRELKHQLAAISQLHNNIRFSYLLINREGMLYIFADSEPAGSGDSSPQMQCYEEACEQHYLSFSGGNTVLTEPFANRWGNWISVLVPMKSPGSGEVIAVLGVDYPAELWKHHAMVQTLHAAFIVLCVYLLIVALSYAFSRNAELKKEKKRLLISEAKLRESEQLFRTVFEQATVGIAIVCDNKYLTMAYNNQTSINPMFERIIGRKKEELEAIGWEAITHPSDLAMDLSKFEEFRTGKIQNYQIEKRYIRPDGSIAWVNMTISPLMLDSSPERCHICIVEDISKRKEVEKALKESEQSKAVLLDNLPGIAYRCNYDKDWTMQFVSKGCLRLTGYDAENLINNNRIAFNDLILPEYREYLWERWRHVINAQSRLSEEYELVTASGEIKWVLEQGQGIFDEDGRVMALEGLIIDITERKKQEMRLKYISEHDILTGLFNRRHFEEFISEESDTSRGSRRAVLLLNIWSFSRISIAYGYVFAEAFIKDIADRLQAICGENCQLYHISIDRFAFYVSGYADRTELAALCDRIFAVVDMSKVTGSIQGSVGIYELEDGRENADNILKFTGIAAEKASHSPAERYCYFSREMEENIIRREIIKSELEEAASDKLDDRLYLEYQPIVDAKTLEIYGFEALARFRSKKLGLVSPAEFIPLAEETQAIVPLGRRIMYMAFSFLKELDSKGFGNVMMSFNVSAIQLLREDFLPDIRRILEETGVNASNLNVEITESFFSDDYEEINKKLHGIRDLGMSTSIDDFGTGYSSLARERELNINCTKIDKQFIDKLLDADAERAIIGDIISMAHKLGQYVVAEGVEHEKQREHLVKNNCDYIQGYLFSRPLTMDKALMLLES